MFYLHQKGIVYCIVQSLTYSIPYQLTIKSSHAYNGATLGGQMPAILQHSPSKLLLNLEKYKNAATNNSNEDDELNNNNK